jgi:GxxExxY protein
MHENDISERVIGAAIEVHRTLGPGLLEAVYEAALCREFELRGIAYESQRTVPVNYKGTDVTPGLRLDLLVEDKVIVELKAKEALTSIDKPQLLTYLRLSNRRLGLIINFHVELLKDGIHRVVNRLTDGAENSA